MGLLKLIGQVAGAAVGSVIPGVGTAIGAKVGGTIGGAVDKKKKPSGSTGATEQPYIQSPKMELGDLSSKSSTLAALQTRQRDTKVAKAAAVPEMKNGVLPDPWKPMKDWYEDLGGDSSKIKIDETLLP